MTTRLKLIAPKFSLISYANIKNQLARIWPTVGISLLLCFAGAGFTVLVSFQTGYPIWKLTRDPAEVEHFPAYIGLLSNWSMMLWTAAASICLFSAVILKRQGAAGERTIFLLASGVLSLYLAIDDLFRLHDKVFPRIFHLSETAFYMLYLLIILGYLLYFLPRILEYEYLLLGAAVLLLGFSRRLFITIPFFDQFMTTGDMLKYFGIVFWLAFFYRTASSEVSGLLSTSNITKSARSL